MDKSEGSHKGDYFFISHLIWETFQAFGRIFIAIVILIFLDLIDRPFARKHVPFDSPIFGNFMSRRTTLSVLVMRRSSFNKDTTRSDLIYGSIGFEIEAGWVHIGFIFLFHHAGKSTRLRKMHWLIFDVRGSSVSGRNRVGIGEGYMRVFF